MLDRNCNILSIFSSTGSTIITSKIYFNLRKMPAPRRPTAAKKTTRIDSAITAPGQLYPSNQTQTVLVTSPQAAKSGDDLALMKFAQLIMYIVALICIWGGILSIAFAGDSTEMNYLILFIGGIISAGMAIGWIEMQSKKNGHQLYEVQNYMLGIGLFFANVGVIWGTRFIMGFATGTMGLELFGTPGEFSNEDWSPNANRIWFQGAGLVALTTVELMILKRYKGEISFGWGIVAYAPVALMLGGVINWMAWSDSLVSYEVGVTMIVMAALSMEMALRSNNTKHFFIVANVAGLLPILYELTNSNAPEQGVGGAISLLLFIIPIMGYYATKPEIKSEVMQKASMGLMALVSFAMLISSANDFNLVLGPIKSATLGEAADYLTLPVMMWIVTLLAFFPAVLDRRVPWMPIGLALMLTLFSEESATIPWLITLAMVPYMLFVNKNARRWVADGTVFALAVSFFLVDLIAKINGIPLEETYGEITLRMQIIIPLALVAISDIGRRMDKISTWPHLSIVAAITLSRTVMDSADWILPWALVVYMLFIAREGLSRAKGSGMKERKDASLVVAISMLATVIM